MNINATMLGQAIAFIFFVLFCMKYIWPPLITIIERRQKEIQDGLFYAEQAKQDLNLAHINATKQLNRAKKEAQMIIEKANQRRIQIQNEAKIDAEKERSKLLLQAQSEIDTEKKRVCEELRKKTAMLAIACAEKIIEHSVNKSVAESIVDKFLAEL